MVAMEWQPEWKRKVGRPKTTWRRTVEKVSTQKRWSSRVEIRGAAQDTASWRETVTALCASWREENYFNNNYEQRLHLTSFIAPIFRSYYFFLVILQGG